MRGPAKEKIIEVGAMRVLFLFLALLGPLAYGFLSCMFLMSMSFMFQSLCKWVMDVASIVFSVEYNPCPIKFNETFSSSEFIAYGMAQLPISFLRPCTSSNSLPALVGQSSKTVRANFQDVTKPQQFVLRNQEAVSCGCRDCSATSDPFNRSLLFHSIHNRDCGKSWPAEARFKFMGCFGVDRIASGTGSVRVAGKCKAKVGGEAGSHASTPDELGRLFIFGFGYTSSALATDLRSKNWDISGTCRSTDARSTLEDCGFQSFLFNSDNDGEELQGGGLKVLQQATHWLVSIPPVGDFDRDPVLAVHSDDLIQAAAMGNVRWVGYLSSTGVYGDWQGEWVDEETEPRPSLPKAVARLAAERDWLKFGRDHGVAVHVFRLGGIYGAGRNAFSTILQNRTSSRIDRERRRFTSRIHVADVCQVLLASMQNPSPGRIYNVVDDFPAPREDVFAYARDLLGVRMDEGVQREKANTNPFYSNRFEEKRVSNKRIKEELGIRLLYPSYESGLQEILRNSSRAGSCV
ncbi:hypothetical protein R1sor_002978 [Riccia sorocarpa]|uniref:NAD-dependent epimerase/dehydratase domain-containing protein n=1 Tax=Riccia sorocarpa TaxID=122646 RepID=A0ABD3H4G4_9MARC